MDLSEISFSFPGQAALSHPGVAGLLPAALAGRGGAAGRRNPEGEG